MATETKSKKSAKGSKPSKPAQPKSTKPTKPTPTHVPTPWAKLKQMWEAGESYEAMAKATDAHYDPTKPDPTKPTRAKIWKARNVGVTIDGKLVRFGPRGKAKEPAKKGKAEGRNGNVKAGKGGKKKPAGKAKAGKKAGRQTAKPSPETNPKPESTSSPDTQSTPSA